ncbi:hypothetical protein M0R45_029469 [Rubus argutus]|uniref:Uncharacterized protein n=1 Tax=Rubus argutus TaxID=59490 RepID=A0AAW1W888_RUBAR
MDHEAHLCNKFVNMKSQRVKVEDSFAPALDDETETFEHLLAEPKTEYVTVDGVLCFGKENAEKCLNFDDFSSGFDYGLNTYSGGRHSAHPRGLRSAHPRQGDYELELGVLDGLLDEVEEVEDIHATNGLASPCDDFLLDIGFTGKVSELEFGPCERSHLGNSESRSPGLSGSSNSAVGVSESSTVTIQEFECKNHSCPKASPHKFPGDFRRKKRRQTPVEGSTCPSSIRLQNFDELDYDQKSLVSGLLSNENEKDSIEANKIGAILKKKRLRKTTQRLVEDSSKKKAKDLMGSEKLSALAATEDLRLKAGSQNKLHHTRPRTLSSVPEEDSISDNLTLSEFRIRIARPKKQAIRTEFQPITSESEDEIVTTIFEKHDRRKHQHIKFDSEDEIVTTKMSEKHDRRKHQLVKSESEDETVTRRRSTRHNRRKHQPINSESEDEIVRRKRSKKHDRRKHQRMWDVSEVMALVDGISEHGVGQWTRIKRLRFTSSAYRTPIDLRDKWRNLLRSSCRKKLKKEVEENEENDMHLPQSLIYRVRELAKKHPYPRQRGKKFAPAILPTESKGASSDLIIKYVRRKNRS